MRPLEDKKWEEAGESWAWFNHAVFVINFFNF